MVRYHVDPVTPDGEAVEQAAKAIREGHVVAIPTDTLYGLAADPFNPAAIARLIAGKRRRAGQAFPLIASDVGQVVEAFGELQPIVRKLAQRYWPGPLTLVIPAVGQLAPEVVSDATVAIRVPAHAVARELCRRSGRPLTATSANVSGEAPPHDPADISGLDQVDVLLDAGRVPGGKPSTIVDTTGGRPRLVRPGAVNWEEIERWLQSE
jgi:L-threonylcarbamoyladenylate synthase